jgi:DNA replicative helicase MCM subunit Mcm2 (Cdc46/Mcm family)
MAQKSKTHDYAADAEKAQAFLSSFSEGSGRRKKYVDALQGVANREKTTVEVYLDDVESFSDSTFVENIHENTKRYEKIFSEAADKIMPESNVEVLEEDVYDVWQHHREQRLRVAAQMNAEVRRSFAYTHIQ